LGLFTYFEINRDYIARVVCVNRDQYNPEEPEITMCGGTCFLQKNLKLIDESSTQDEKVPSSHLKVEIPSFVLSEHHVALIVVIIDNELHSTPYLIGDVSGISASIFHPPSLS